MYAIYDVEPEFEKYYIIYSHKNYFLYYIEGNEVYVMELHDEREDDARTLFGIVTTTQETLNYWRESLMTEVGGRKIMGEAVEKYAERKVAVSVKEERNQMTQIVAALVAGKDKEL